MIEYKHAESLLCNNFIRIEAKRLVNETPPSQLITDQVKEEKIYQEIVKILDENVLLAAESLQLIVEKLPELNCPTPVLKEIWTMQTKQELLDPKNLERELSKDSFAEILGLSQTTLDWMYQVVDHFLLRNEPQKAVQSLYILNLICPENGLYWLALGHAYFHLKQYDKALEAYQKSFAADPEDPRGLIWMAHTYEALKLPANALGIVNELVDLLGDDDALGDLRGYQRNLQGVRR